MRLAAGDRNPRTTACDFPARFVALSSPVSHDNMRPSQKVSRQSIDHSSALCVLCEKAGKVKGRLCLASQFSPRDMPPNSFSVDLLRKGRNTARNHMHCVGCACGRCVHCTCVCRGPSDRPSRTSQQPERKNSSGALRSGLVQRCGSRKQLRQGKRCRVCDEGPASGGRSRRGKEGVGP